jgi:small GTP-binding protein
MDSVSLNIIIIGDTSVGKTTLMKRFIDGIFNEKILSTLGVELFRKQVKINDNDYVLKIWDTCGQERFRTLTKNYYKNAEGIMLLFDIHSIDSFQHLNNWMKSLNENFNGSDIPLVVVASKCDLEQMITDNEIEDYSNKNNVKIYKSSAKDNIQVEEPFLYLANEIIENKKKKRKDINTSIVLKAHKHVVQKKRRTICC